ncbi:pyridoxine/pyridoxamine 5'-phosphate oxidase [Georgenia sp. MJ170]|uniref:pyridoxine/pyridoxamine 5'-phosphate oxidase n=1 Tax=Georgenia sunbinii TaxID=3117728 RepID=UPI002F26BA9B
MDDATPLSATSDHPEFRHSPEDPLQLLQAWFAAADRQGVREPMAATLATTGPDGSPSARFVALKDISADGLVFATSETSPKGLEMTADPRVALTLYWSETMQQLRIKGVANMLDDDASDRLFDVRPRGARAAVIAARQSEPLDSDTALEQAVASLASSEQPLVRPSSWRGWLVTPTEIEFWLGGRDRLHRRLAYTRSGEGWTARRLQP